MTAKKTGTSKVTTSKATAKKPTTKGKLVNKATGKTELPPSFYNPGKKRGKDIPDD
jgi:hypothetical protein